MLLDFLQSVCTVHLSIKSAPGWCRIFDVGFFFDPRSDVGFWDFWDFWDLGFFGFWESDVGFLM